MTVAIVTDSTAYLPASLAAQYGIEVVPMTVVVSGRAMDEDEVQSKDVVNALESWQIVTTSAPNPERLLTVYRALAKAGASHIVSVHISSLMSGTYASALGAAAQASIPVTVIDSQTVGMALGYGALAGAKASKSGADAPAVETAIRASLAGSSEYFYVDTLEHLRRGGRINAGQALIGQALSVKPLLCVRGGRVEQEEKVRTSSRALSRLSELAFDAASQIPGKVQIAVHHLAAAERAQDMMAKVTAKLKDRIHGEPVVTEVGAAVGAHVGPGMVAVVVAPHLN